MSDAKTFPTLKAAFQDSNNESPSSSGKNSPIAIAKAVVSDKGALFIACLLAVACAAWAAARVDSLKDHIDENQRITQMQIDHYKDEFYKLDRQVRMTELKLDDWTVVAHRAGLQLPGDYTRGPQGNLDAESFHIKSKGK